MVNVYHAPDHILFCRLFISFAPPIFDPWSIMGIPNALNFLLLKADNVY